MELRDEAARNVEESIPAGLPSCDLTDDFLADLDQFIDSTLFEQSSGPLAVEPPPFTSTEISTAVERQADIPQDPPANLAVDTIDPKERKLLSNRLAQARLRERKKV